MSDLKNFELESIENIKKLSSDPEVKNVSQEWINKTGPHKYVYNWRWMGLPIIQLPADVVATQEIIWMVKPTVIIETGVARGGSLIFNASQLALLDLCENGKASIEESKRRCIGIDIDIRQHNRDAIVSHPLSPMIQLIEGSSISDQTLNKVKNLLHPEDKVLVILDSNHTHDHVKAELEQYSPLVSCGSYIIVHDTGIEYAVESLFHNRDWGIGNNPLTASKEFLLSNKNFQVDQIVSGKLQITSSPDGYLKRIQ
ncbi:MAG: CmcI family methyltransferase [Pseudanabaenaceae cyanobacterium bins.39]|nr:CmcI family methyltransferase [Pseudanabaenaceae cyanobacterium bins.39]